MPKRLVNITGYEGVDATTDPYLLGKEGTKKSVLSYNLRAKNGVRVGRNGYQTAVDGAAFTKSGVYFPYGAHGVLPLTKLSTDMRDTFYACNTTAFTIEFWYNATYEAFARYICNIPVNLPNSTTRHMSVTLDSSTEISGRCLLELWFAVDTGAGTIEQCKYYWDEPIPVDGDWHHIALVRAADGSDIVMYIDAESPGYSYDSAVNHETDALADWDDFLELSDEPLWHNYMWLGDGNLRMSEFRIWKEARTFSEIGTYYDVSLAGTETNLVCYVPFDEGDGKYFTDAVTSARGYFSPQEPFVNDDNELVFTGRKCLAFPSLRAKYELMDKDNTLYDVARHSTSHDGAMDMSILFDATINVGWPIAESHEEPGPFRGVAQIRLKLRQLKEGVIAGRLGLVYIEADDCYRLYYYLGAPDINAQSEYQHAYFSSAHDDGKVDASWIGVEKTITLYWDGKRDDGENLKMYVDDVEVGPATPDTTPEWSSGDEFDDTGYVPFINMEFTNSNDPTEENDLDGAFGGSPKETAFCTAFDLVFYREWFDKWPVVGVDNAELDNFVSVTYDQEDLNDSYKYYAKGISGYLADNLEGGQALFDTTDYLPFFSVDPFQYLQLIRIPFHFHSDNFEMRGAANADTYFYRNGTTTWIPKQDVIVMPCKEWTAVGAKLLFEETSATPNRWQMPSGMGTKRRFNGATISNMISFINSDTLKNNQLERPIYYQSTDDFSLSDMEIDQKTLNIFNTITDDTPLQGSEKLGSGYYDSRYWILTAFGTRTDTIANQRSVKPRWCSGPVSYVNASLPPIRGIHRYKSEDGLVDKFLVVTDAQVWEVNTSLGTATALDYAWLDRNSDVPVNFVSLNNKLIISDTEGAIKINYKGNFSRLGIERPMQVLLNDIETEAEDSFLDGEQYAYVAQFYDSENNSYSGTIPVYSDHDQQIIVVGDSTVNGADHFDVAIRTCRDQNVDQFFLYRTANLATEATILYLVKQGALTAKDDSCTIRDMWANTELVDNAVLPTKYYGVDVFPPPSGVSNVAYGRLFMFGAEKANSTLYWSNVDALGLGNPDEFHPLNSIIVEEGGTTSGTALIEYNSVLYAFKEDSIFKVEQYSPGLFSVQLLYKGVGAINQRCVLMAGDSVVFLDKTGLYTYRGGEPMMLSTQLIDFFKEQVNADQMDKAFLLHNKVEELVLAFVPGSSSTYPDRCVVYDLRTGLFTIDLLPYVTCGYVDDTTVYLGTAYGKILEYDTTSHKDVVGTVIAAAATVTSLTVTSTSAFPNDGTTMGARLFLYDSDNKIWTGIVDTETDTSNVDVEAWEPLFNTTATSPSSSGTMRLGHIYYHDESPMFSFFEDSRSKKVNEIQVTTNRVSASTVSMFHLIDMNDSGTTVDGTQTMSGSLQNIKTFSGLHRNYQVTLAGFYTDELKVKELSHNITFTQGRKDQD